MMQKLRTGVELARDESAHSLYEVSRLPYASNPFPSIRALGFHFFGVFASRREGVHFGAEEGIYDTLS